MHNPNTTSSSTRQNDPEMLVKYIVQDPRYQEVVECVRQGKSLSPELKSWLQHLKDIFIADPKDFYGTACVTKDLKKEAALTAHTNTAANLVDFVSNLSLYYFAFKSLGEIPAFILGVALDGFILWISNITATTTATRRAKNVKWARAGLGGMIALNLLKSLFSGVGGELLNNQSGLNQQMAAQLIEQQIERVEKLKEIDTPQYTNTVQRCEKGRIQLEKMERNHARRDSLHIELFGSWNDRHRDWIGVPLEQLPICLQVPRLEKEAYAPYEKAKDQLNQKLIRRADIGNDLLFLKQEMPAVYSLAFIDKGNISSTEISSGVAAVAIATDNFFGKLCRGEFASLGFSLFFFSISIITSAIAVWKTMKYAERQDVQMSRNEAIACERDLWLEERWQELVERHQQELEALEQAEESYN